MRGSGWRFVAVQQLDTHTVQYEPLKGSSYIPLPKYLADKKAIINLKNEDGQCFKWCLARALNPVEKNSERVTKELRKQAEGLNWKRMAIGEYVASIKDGDFSGRSCVTQ